MRGEKKKKNYQKEYSAQQGLIYIWKDQKVLDKWKLRVQHHESSFIRNITENSLSRKGHN